jgi:hypothetical protein
MGTSPPIPVDPIQAVPETVLRQTPGQNHPALNVSQNPGQQLPQQQMSQDTQQMYSNMAQHGQVPMQQQAPMNGFPSNQMQPPPTHGSYFPDTSNQPMNNGQSDQLPKVYPHGFGRPSAHRQPMNGQVPPNGMANNGLEEGMNDFRQMQHPSQPPMMPPMGASHPSNNGQLHQSSRSEQRPRNGPPQPSTDHSRRDGHRRGHSLSVPARSADVGTYLDRVENDPKLQYMLSGAPARTVHTSAPVTGSSVNTHTDKPLPDPRGRSKRTVSRRQSLMDDLHNHRNPGNISSGDRYPSFPVNGKGHSRQSSFNATTRNGGPPDM